VIRQDRFLLGILAGIVILVVLSLVIFFARQGSVGYGPEDTPQGVIQNYIIAIGKGDYERAFRYVAGPPSPAGPGLQQVLPDFNNFKQFFFSGITSQLANTGVQVGESRINGDIAVVDVTILQTSGDPFRSIMRQTQQAQLIIKNGTWKINQGPYPFWSYDWSGPQGKTIPAVPVPAIAASATPTP
jgi:hypothetical protein